MLKVLVAPLDWGLGHATRCIPIIHELVIQGCTIIVAANGIQKAILQEEFPALTFIELPGYDIKYTKNRAFTVLKIIGHIPKILISINEENRWLSRFSLAEGLDAVISDNRYGLYAPGVRSIFMTHQLAIRTGLGRIADRWLQRVNYGFIGRFSACWVPDAAGPDNLAGALSHPRRMPRVPVRYIGPLSRFAGRVPGSTGDRRSEGPVRSMGGTARVAEFDLLVVLSGPEPQRTILERLVLGQLKTSQLTTTRLAVHQRIPVQQAPPAIGKVVLVRGLPLGGGEAMSGVPPGVEVHDHLPAERLEELVALSSIVLSRPGYSTVMDLARLGKKAIFIPTPGQTEQEYLGRYLAGKGWAVCQQQRNFDLQKAFTDARDIKSTPAEPAEGRDLLRQAIAELIDGTGLIPSIHATSGPQSSGPPDFG